LKDIERVARMLDNPVKWRISAEQRENALATTNRKRGINGPKNSRCDQLLRTF
jgi:hypothetical protein